jgi:hypothetical protein
MANIPVAEVCRFTVRLRNKAPERPRRLDTRLAAMSQTQAGSHKRVTGVPRIPDIAMGLLHMRRTISSLLVAAAIAVGTTVSPVTAYDGGNARYGPVCWWEDGYRRCTTRCLEGCRRPKYRRPRPLRSPHWQQEPQPLEIHLSIPEWIGSFQGLGIIGCLVALLLHALKRR